MTDDPLSSGEPPTSVLTNRATWRVIVDVRDLDHRPLDALRMLLVADVLRRRVEDLQGGLVFLAVLEPATGPSAARDDLAQALWIRAPSTRTSSPTEAAALLGGPSSIVLVPEEPGRAATGASDPGRTLRVAAVTTPPHGEARLSNSGLLVGHVPLVLRLALLRFPYWSPATLTLARLHRAEETLQRWRFKVADWADMPPAPALQHSVDTMRDALVANLDTGTVLKVLHQVEVDLNIASGSKFETFAYLDRVLALDLRHLVGKLRK